MVRVKFPHFTLEEAEVLEAFQKKFTSFFNWQYDVRLKSKKFELADIKEPTLRLMWKALTAKRIDAVCEDGVFVNIIEVKRVMLSSGIGQLLVYGHMYEKQFKPGKPIRLWLIAKYPDPDVEEVANNLGIKTWSMVK